MILKDNSFLVLLCDVFHYACIATLVIAGLAIKPVLSLWRASRLATVITFPVATLRMLVHLHEFVLVFARRHIALVYFLL